MGPGDQHLGPPGGVAHVHHVDLDVHALLQRLAGDLLPGQQQRLGGLRAGADAEGGRAVPGVDAGDHAGEDLVLLGVEFVVDLAPLGLPEALDDDLLAVSGGDAAEFHFVHRDVHHVADLIPGGEGLGLLQGHLVEGVHIVLLVHHGLADEHAQLLVLLVRLHDDVFLFHVLVVPLVGGGDGLDDLLQHSLLGNAPFLLQQFQGGEDFPGVHAGGFFLLLASHLCRFSLNYKIT